MTDFHSNTVPQPRTSQTSALSASRPISLPSTDSTKHVRRPSFPMSPSLLSTSPRAVPVPVPERHGSISRPRAASTYTEGLIIPRSVSPARMPLAAMSPPTSTSSQKRQSQHQKNASSSASLASLFAPSSAGGSDMASAADLSRSKSDRRRSMMADIRRSGTKESLKELAEDEGKWLDITAEHILAGGKEAECVKVVSGNMGMEEAVEIMIQSNYQCLLVEKRSSFAFFDYADLNTFLLLVLHASSSSPRASRSPSRSVSIKRTSKEYPAGESAVIDDIIEPDGILDERSRAIVARLRRHEKVHIGSVCDISGKDPYHAFPLATPLRTLLPVFASGLHKMALTTTSTTPPRVLTDLAVIEHLVSLDGSSQPIIFKLPITSSAASFPLHPLISLSGTASVLDAMQVMSMNGLSALGVLSGPGSLRDTKASRRQSSSGSSSSSSGAIMFRSSSSGAIITSPLVSPAQEMLNSPFDALGTGMGMGELKSVVTVKQCTRVVVPSEGKQVLGMGLEDMVKMAQYVEEAGQDRGEERVPVHTVPYNSTILHAAHLILATSSSRVFLRPPSIPLSPQPAPTTVSGLNTSPPLSPAPSLSTSQYSPPSSPSLSSLSLSDIRIPANASALPVPPPTQLSTHYVVSTLDILSCLARTYHDKLTPPAGVHRLSTSASAVIPGEGERRKRERDKLRGSIMIPSGWELDPEALRRRRQSSFASQVSPISGQVDESNGEGKEEGFGRWRWASRVGKV